jgi:DNA repair ATPase RecN
MNKYSDWFKVDLHIHTDKSNVVKQNDYDGVFDLSVLKKKLIENDVKIFSLTDHNIINIDAYKNYYDNYNEGDPVLFVGCEFDIKVIQDDGSDLTYHTLLIFNESTKDKVDEINTIIEGYFTVNNIPFPSRCLTDNEIFELFSPYHFFYIPHAGGHKNIIEAYAGTDIKKAQEMVLLLECAHEKVKEVHRIKHHKGFDKLKDPAFQNKQDEAFINFSDNHSCTIYPLPKNGTPHEFYCIKGQPTFESIRFAFIDPKSRIKKFSEVEVLRRFDNFIHSIEMINNPSIEETTLYFSPNLNVIIGGRSSGKSLLFNILGSKIGNAKNSLAKYGIDVSEIKIRSFLDHDYKSKISYNLQDIIYINQGEIVNYFENNTLTDLIKESGKTEEYKNALDYFKEQKKSLIKSIERLVDVYSELFDSINANFTLHNKDIDAIFDTSYFFRPIEQVEDKTASFQNSFQIVQNLSENIEKFIIDENWTLTPEELEIVNNFKKIVELKNSSFQDQKSLHLRRRAFIDDVNKIIRSKNTTLDLKGREKEASNHRLETLKSQIFELIKTSFTVEEHCSTLENYKYNFSQAIEIDENVSVIIEIENKEDVKSKIFEGINLTSQNLSLYQVLIQLAKNDIKIKHLPDNSIENFRKKINTQLKTIFDYFDKPIEYLKYAEQGTSKNNSPGFNSEKYLETILRKGNSKIIFIDQPEDNLGNKFITDNLIDLLRELKFKKQIFLVTHNPSIVVYGDAESVIMCTNSENKIRYEQFVLEDKSHQKEICNVLDGGHYIFEQRAKKYNIKKLIN